MVSMDAALDFADDNQMREFIEADTSNQVAFLELSHYQQTTTFLFQHPILKLYKLEHDLNQLRKIDPQRFMNELINADKNITRYQSYINNNKYKNEDEKASWLELIKDYTYKLSVMKTIISI